MITHSEAIDMLRHAAVRDDVSFKSTLLAWRDTNPPPDATFDDLLTFIGEMLDAGFEVVTSPWTMPQSHPWPEQDRPAIFDRITRAWDGLTEEPTFLDICWFHLPPERHPAPD